MATNWLQLLKNYIGYQGAASLADKLTVVRAGYLDNINNAQLLVVPNLSTLSAVRIGYLDNINQVGLLQVTAVRAGYLDNIGNAQLLNVPNLATLTVARIGYLDNLSGGAVALAASWTAALATALGNYTAARAGYLDNINQAGLLQVTAARAALLDQITAARLAQLDAANIPADTDPRVMGRSQIKATTINLNQVAASYNLFTGTTQAVILESLNIKMPNLAAGGALTSISIQTDDVTPGVIISAANGAVANLTAEADLGWTGTLYITVGTIIQLTIAGGAHGVAYVCNVTGKYRAVVSGGLLT